MSAVELKDGERGDRDLIAAEYVLGVLPADERLDAARRIQADPEFAQLVDGWEVMLSPLGVAYVPVEPPVAVKEAVDRRLFSGAAAASDAAVQGSGIWASLAFWRGLAAAAVAGLLLLAALPYLNPPVQMPQARLVASLAADGSDVRYLVVYDAADGDVALSHVSGERSAGHDFELWMIEGPDKPPVSMGVIPAGATAHLAIAEAARQKLASGAVLAVSLEPLGGSPTGQPTGAVVAAGDLKSI